MHDNLESPNKSVLKQTINEQKQEILRGKLEECQRKILDTSRLFNAKMWTVDRTSKWHSL